MFKTCSDLSIVDDKYRFMSILNDYFRKKSMKFDFYRIFDKSEQL